MPVLEGCKYCSPAHPWRFLELEVAARVAPRLYLVCEVKYLMVESELLDEHFVFFRVVGGHENILVSASGNSVRQLSFSLQIDVLPSV